MIIFIFFLLGHIAAGIDTSSAVERCEIGWSKLNNFCYKAIKMMQPWSFHKRQCEILGGQLTSIHSREENNFVNGLVQSTGVTKFRDYKHQTFIGAYRQNGQWRWLDGTSVEFSNWMPSEFIGDDDCAVMGAQGAWNDFPCQEHSLITSICKKKL